MTIKELQKELDRWSEMLGENSKVYLHLERTVAANFYEITGVSILDQGEIQLDADYVYTYEFED